MRLDLMLAVLSILATLQGHAQYYGEYSVWYDGRYVVAEPAERVLSTSGGMLHVLIAADTAGNVISAEFGPDGQSCSDTLARKRALEYTRGLRLNARPDGEAKHRGNVYWKFLPVVRQFPKTFGAGAGAPPPPPPKSVIDEEFTVYEAVAVTEQPRFIGGEEAMDAFLGREVSYPSDAIEAGIQGKVYVEFVVEMDGSLSDVRTKRGVHPSLDMEAVRAVKSMPKWAPGRMNGKPVRVRWVLPPR